MENKYSGEILEYCESQEVRKHIALYYLRDSIPGGIINFVKERENLNFYKTVEFILDKTNYHIKQLRKPIPMLEWFDDIKPANMAPTKRKRPLPPLPNFEDNRPEPPMPPAYPLFVEKKKPVKVELAPEQEMELVQSQLAALKDKKVEYTPIMDTVTGLTLPNFGVIEAMELADEINAKMQRLNTLQIQKKEKELKRWGF